MKALDHQVAVRRHRTARPSVGKKRIAFLADDEFGICLREHQRAAEGRIDWRDQQTMIATRQRGRDIPGGIAAKAVGNPPFAPLGGCEIAADFVAELNRRKPLQRFGGDLRRAIER
jgi:hypothetical protein